MIIPISWEQVAKGELHAQPGPKAKAKQCMDFGAGNRSGATGAMSDEDAQQVMGAVEPTQQTLNTFHKYTPAPVEGMSDGVRWLSSLAISRWGLEALSDLCVHGTHSTEESAYKILNTVTISFHPDDVGSLERGLDDPTVGTPLESHFWSDKGPYLGIMTAYALLMLLLILIVMKRKDVK
jgi:hypothetical protein